MKSTLLNFFYFESIFSFFELQAIERLILINFKTMKNILILLNFLPFLTAFDYCEICNNHIACNNNGELSVKCPRDARIFPLSAKEIDTILIAHNTARNKIAGGREFGFPMASRMMAVVRKK